MGDPGKLRFEGGISTRKNVIATHKFRLRKFSKNRDFCFFKLDT